ncbi:MAG: hypothetical protein ACR2ME_02235 [Acidimicrobiia bacterium]
MADLDAEDREDIPTKDFGFPEKARTKEAKKESGNYPMPDKAHARNAKSRAAQQQKAGNLTKNEKERIDRKADKILDE